MMSMGLCVECRPAAHARSANALRRRQRGEEEVQHYCGRHRVPGAAIKRGGRSRRRPKSTLNAFGPSDNRDFGVGSSTSAPASPNVLAPAVRAAVATAVLEAPNMHDGDLLDLCLCQATFTMDDAFDERALGARHIKPRESDELPLHPPGLNLSHQQGNIDSPPQSPKGEALKRFA